MIRDAPSPNHDARPDGEPVNVLLLHYTGMLGAAEALDRLRDPAPPTGTRVSSHYVVDEDGTVWRLVAENRRAWHAGASHWRGREGLNGCSIGIEIVNPGHEWGYRDFPAPQMAAVRALCRNVLARHPIPPGNVLAHSDVAPDRKQDPGERFAWRDLARHGIGLWPERDGPPAEAAAVRTLLRAIGYRADGAVATAVLLRAFQRHWRPESVTGLPDPGTLARLAAVAALANG